MLNNLAIVSQLMSHSVMIYNTFLFVETPGKFITVMIYCGRSVDIDMNRKIELYFFIILFIFHRIQEHYSEKN